ncbi:MAG: transketolase [Gammaproteobacteria bacterium]|nr:transketolase [Gammaproteobacteria bacterium]NIR98276.1 transketolase [Gammaproteobacteria bacterium]NIT63951.1 transketolase [Gammaproteobacteria bacterium]NIV20949.1 transketolase [Gammaproteobacteria bacterium]NIX10240.1 transketolase [Gammaproteobacteria bacterium]
MATIEESLAGMPVGQLSIQTIRTLAMDAVQRAESGHPGTPMALAPAGYVLWTRFLRHSPANPQWPDRDRFVLSNGHASMLLYALLHLTGYDLPLDELKRFRQLGSRTPGHPEHGLTPGVETTTGPLGQGLMNSVGMASAEAHLAAVFNRPGHELIDHHTYVFCSDGDLMEGASHEAASLAGHLALGKLIWLYDDNRISIDGDTAVTFSDDHVRRFEGYHWHVQDLGDRANDVEALDRAFAEARAETARPSLIVLRSHIAYGAPNKQDTAAAHGAPLGEEEVARAKRVYGWPPEASFLVPEQVREHMGAAQERGRELEAEWERRLDAYRRAFPDAAQRLQQALEHRLPEGWDADLPRYGADERQVATRAAAGVALNHFARRVPWLLGGAADLASSTKALIDEGSDFARDDRLGRNLRWGVREHVMCAACSGMALHGGVRPFASTFLIFTDYARPAIRLAALMGLPVIYVASHDSIGLGEDGPTHQPVEHLASLRAMPGMCVIRPADANEAVEAWRTALARRDGPTMLVLSRQKLPVLDRRRMAPAAGLARGGYVLSPERGARADLILIASGSELQLALAAQGRLMNEQGIDARVVSMPSWELFRGQPADYRDQVLPSVVNARLAIEAGSPLGWSEWVGQAGAVIAVERFGASAPAADLFKRFGFTVDRVLEEARGLLGA